MASDPARRCDDGAREQRLIANVFRDLPRKCLLGNSTKGGPE
jgi:hypothetical protein